MYCNNSKMTNMLNKISNIHYAYDDDIMNAYLWHSREWRISIKDYISMVFNNILKKDNLILISIG